MGSWYWHYNRSIMNKRLKNYTKTETKFVVYGVCPSIVNTRLRICYIVKWTDIFIFICMMHGLQEKKNTKERKTKTMIEIQNMKENKTKRTLKYKNWNTHQKKADLMLLIFQLFLAHRLRHTKNRKKCSTKLTQNIGIWNCMKRHRGSNRIIKCL